MHLNYPSFFSFLFTNKILVKQNPINAEKNKIYYKRATDTIPELGKSHKLVEVLN